MWGKNVIRGISNAIRQRLPWDLLIAPRDSQWRFRVPRSWQGDGVIAAIRDSKTEEHIQALQVPTVNVSAAENLSHPWPRVNTDDHERADLALQHFLDRGFENFAYFGPPSQRYPDKRGVHFQQVVAAAGFDCRTFKTGRPGRFGWAVQPEQTLTWLQELPKPVAIFAADPHPALQLTEACRAADIRIPEEVAILAGDWDDLLCEVSSPPLSSIVLASEQIGEESVQMLEELFRAKPPEAPLKLIPPVRVIARESTDTLAIRDQDFVAALRFIRDNAHEGIQVNDVLKASTVSRRMLELLFRKHLRRSPADEIRRVRLAHVTDLLLSTDQTVEEIALASGFAGGSQLCVFFRRETSVSPQAYRRQKRRP